MNFFDVKRFLARNQYVFLFAKRCFNLSKQAISYPERKKKAKRKTEEIRHARLSGARVIWYCCVAIHPNLGDLAQTMCTLDWLRETYPDTSIVELPSRDFYFGKCSMMSVLKDSVRPDDLIVFQSGYTMTGVHENEPMREMIINAFPDNRIVLLPQTIFYQTKEQETWAIHTYKDRKNLLLLARDRISYETAKELFGSTQMALFPDIVTTLIGTRKYDGERCGVLFCVRDDWERLYSEKEMAALMQSVGQYTHVDQTDTTVRLSNTEDREAVRAFIDETIQKYSRYQLIVTDRYHGTIFSLIAGTPVIVLKTTDHKVITGAEWFAPCMSDYIAVADTLKAAERLIPQMLEQPRETVKNAWFREKYYDQLKNLIEEDTQHVEESGGGGVLHIAVITSAPTVKNYGAYLQAYATQRLLEKYGYKVELIPYSRNTLEEAVTIKEIAVSLKERKIFRKLPVLFRCAAALMLFPSVSRQGKSFSAFAERYLHVMSAVYLDESGLKANPPQSDIYCTGGDQMWNEQHNGHKTMREYYLSWAPEGKPRISLFTSLGKDRFDEWEKEEVRELLSNYSLISVREGSGKKAVEDLGIENVYHHQDPTILLDVEEWEALSARRIIKEKYILLYEISRKAPLAAYAKELARRTGLKVVRINYYTFDALKYGKAIMAPTLEQFLSLFRYAEYVITNSFHGTAFSMAFGQKFAAVAGTNPGRLQSVLEYYGMEERICGEPTEIYEVINQAVDYAEVGKRIFDARRDFDEYMKKVTNLL